MNTLNFRSVALGLTLCTAALSSLAQDNAKPAYLDPSLPPEAILSGSEVYTMHVNLPNLTSVSGSC